MAHYSPWETLRRNDDKDPISSEFERWRALLAEPLALIRTPLKYGHLTVSGFLHARTSRELDEKDGWPKDPVGVAALLKTCGIKEKDVAYVTRELEGTIDSNIESPTGLLLEFNKALLKSIGVEPNIEHLLAFLDDYNWEYSYFDDLRISFDTMKDYLPTVELQEEFISRWLPNFKAGYNVYGTEDSPGLALATGFPNVNTQHLIDWCKSNDDQVGLGFLVCQGKFTYTDWLLEVAEPSCGVRTRSNREDYDTDHALRRIEQFQTFEKLIEYVGIDKLKEDAKTFFATYPEKVEQLLERFVIDPTTDQRFRWCCMLIETGVVPSQHPMVLQGINTAYVEQQDFIEQAFDDENKSRIEFRSMDEALHDSCGPIACEINENAITYLTREAILRVRYGDARSFAKFMQDNPWMKGVPVSDALNVRIKRFEKDAYIHVAAFFPYLSNTEKKEFAPYLLDVVSRQPDRATFISTMLHAIDPEKYTLKDDAPYSGFTLAMSQITQVDPSPFFTSLKSLDIAVNDPAAIDLIKQWVVANIPSDTAKVELPQDMGSDMLGIFEQLDSHS